VNKYIIDTSALIDAKETYPPENFKPFWDLLHEMNDRGMLIIPKKVKHELKRGNENDFLRNEFLIDKKITNDEDQETINCLDYIIKKIPQGNPVGFQLWLTSADPYVIACALRISRMPGPTDEKVMLIHCEVERGNKIMIPYVCRLLGIEFGKMNKIITEEKIRFTIK